LNGSAAGGASTLKGGAGDDHITGGPGPDTIDPGPGNDVLAGGGGSDTYVGKNVASVDEITSLTGDGTLDMSDRHENITFVAADGKLLAGWGAQGTTASFLTGPTVTVSDFAHMMVVDNIDSVHAIKGGSGADSFVIYQTGSGFTTLLNGQGGNDTYDLRNVGHGAHIAAEVQDVGNPWDSGDQITVDGSDNSAGDAIVATSTQVCSPDCGSPSQVVTYDPPDASGSVLSLQVNGNGGPDRITVQSTDARVPVRVDGGAGMDLVTVGTGSLTGITGIARSGLSAPTGLGPLVVVGGDGVDSLKIDGSTDTNGRTGFMTAFLESRVTAPNGVEVGVVSGLGMQLFSDSAAFLGASAPGDGRVEFEGFESVNVLLGNGADTFTVGGDSLLGTGAGKLPPVRQEKVLRFIHTPSAMVSVDGGGGPDTLRVLSTGQVDRAALDAGQGVVNVATLGAAQHLDIAGQKTDATDTYTLGNGSATTAAINFMAGETAVQGLLTSAGIAGTVKAAGGGGFNITGAAALVARLAMPLVAVTGSGLLQHVVLSPVAGFLGHFTLKYRYQETRPLPFDVTAADLTLALQQAFTLVGTPSFISATSAGAGAFDINFNAAVASPATVVAEIVPLIISGGPGDDVLNVQSLYEDAFWRGGDGSDSANLNLEAVGLKAFHPTDVVGHVEITPMPPDTDGHQKEQVTVNHATGGTFNLTFGYDVKPMGVSAIAAAGWSCANGDRGARGEPLQHLPRLRKWRRRPLLDLQPGRLRRRRQQV